jgi:hypothetical protein
MAPRAAGGWGVSALLFAAAVVLFVLAAFSVDVGDFDRLDLIALGLAAFAAAHLV